MLPVCIMRRQCQFHVTGQLDAAGTCGPIDQRHPPNLYVIFRVDDNLGIALDVLINAPKYGTVQRKVGAVLLDLAAGGLIGIAP